MLSNVLIFVWTKIQLNRSRLVQVWIDLVRRITVPATHRTESGGRGSGVGEGEGDRSRKAVRVGWAWASAAWSIPRAAVRRTFFFLYLKKLKF